MEIFNNSARGKSHVSDKRNDAMHGDALNYNLYKDRGRCSSADTWPSYEMLANIE